MYTHTYIRIYNGFNQPGLMNIVNRVGPKNTGNDVRRFKDIVYLLNMRKPKKGLSSTPQYVALLDLLEQLKSQ